jgi:hypothetical protein
VARRRLGGQSAGLVQTRIRDKAFEAHLAEQLQRASDGWDPPLPGHPHAELAGEVATALVEAGFDLHHCARPTRREPGGLDVLAV